MRLQLTKWTPSDKDFQERWRYSCSDLSDADVFAIPDHGHRNKNRCARFISQAEMRAEGWIQIETRQKRFQS
jgi:hypothetical protein